jgi:serine/threonine protein kinase
MTDEQWQTAWKLFQSTGSVPPERAREFLDAAKSDPAVREALLELLQAPETADRLNRSGQRLGRYVLTEPLGAGGMGEVYAARDPELSRLVAIKILTAPAVGNSSPDRLIQEAKAASALNHPNIVTIHEVIRADSRLAIVMELVEGASLRQLCDSPLAVDQIVRIGEQLARALAAAHARGIVHFDIKPENVMVRQDGLVKILDFGLARDVASLTHSGLPAGTLRYMSPEQSGGEGPAQPSDVFSLGIVLYEMATGTHPFERSSIFETLKAINQGDLVAPSSLNPFVPLALETVISRMLAKDPAQRPTMSAVTNQFEGRFVSSPALPLVTAAPPRRRRWFFAAVIAILAAVLVAILYPYLRKAISARDTPAASPTERQIVASLGVNVLDAAISPDGSLLAFADEAGLHLKLIDTGESYPIPSPDGGRIYEIGWFPDNHNLLLSITRGPGLQTQLWTVSIFGGIPTLIRDDVREASASPDGAQIAFTTNAQDSLWSMNRSGEQPRKLVPAAPGFSIAYPAWYPGTHNIVYVSVAQTDPTRPIYAGRSSFQSFDTLSGKVGSFPAVPGTVGEFAILRDGKMLYLSDALREIQPDLSAHPTEPARVLRSWNRLGGYHLTASMDGKRITVLRRTQEHGLFVGGLTDGGKRLQDVRPLKLSGNSNTTHSWTPDGQGVVFESNRDGVWRIFAQSLDRPSEERVLATQAGAVAGRFSPDGKWLYYIVANQGGGFRMMRTLYAGGLPQTVASNSGLKNYYCTTLPANFCVIGFAEQNQLVFRRLDPQADPPADGFDFSQLRELARTDYSPTDWGLSPDGSRVAMVRPEPDTARIHIVPLDPDHPGRPAEDVIVKGWTRLQTLNWAYQGRGWYVSNRVDSNGEARAEASFAFIDPIGQATLLDAPGSFSPAWGVASPDGRHLALTSAPGTVTVWLIEGF